MPRVIITEGAIRGLERCRLLLIMKNPLAAKQANQAISKQFQLLETGPGIGRPPQDLPELRELIIP